MKEIVFHGYKEESQAAAPAAAKSSSTDQALPSSGTDGQRATEATSRYAVRNAETLVRVIKARLLKAEGSHWDKKLLTEAIEVIEQLQHQLEMETNRLTP